jgi:hypothetical protein
LREKRAGEVEYIGVSTQTRQDRCRLQVPVLLSNQVVGITLDVGAGGVGLLAPSPFGIGEQLQLELVLPNRRAGLAVIAQVVWCSEVARGEHAESRLRFRCGVRIRAIGVRESLWLRNYLAARRAA